MRSFSDDDYYWNPLCRTDMYKDPKLGVGSIIDDVQELKKVLDEKVPPTIIAFDRLGNVIIAIGESISKSDIPY